MSPKNLISTNFGIFVQLSKGKFFRVGLHFHQTLTVFSHTVRCRNTSASTTRVKPTETEFHAVCEKQNAMSIRLGNTIILGAAARKTTATTQQGTFTEVKMDSCVFISQ
mmetsp:Transcript_23556/g.33045  ORF Transcript_23556/g.33045 Transcript_23556/m.33045 type:complete len:109 (+) Transcript_23556:270-596(+)